MLHLAGAGLFAASVAGCAPGSTIDRPPREPAGPVSTDISGAGDVTIEVWDFQNSGTANDWMERLNADFIAAHPHVTINRVALNFLDLQTKLPLAVTRNDPPDVVAVNQGWYPQGGLVKAGELLPLDAYADAYGWRDRYPASLLRQHMFVDDASAFGAGSLYGMPTALAYTVGFFYNAGHLRALGIEVPTTYEQFEDALAAAKRGGLLPVQMGNLSQFDLFILYSTVLNTQATQDWVTDLVYGLADVSFDTPASNRTAELLMGWIERGYVPDDFEGVDTSEAIEKFAAGEGVFFNQGSSVHADLAALGDDLGFVLLPPRRGAKLIASGSSQQNFSVTRRSAHHDVSAAYLDHCSGEYAAGIAAEMGLPPLLDIPSGAPTGSSFDDLVAAQRDLSENDGFVPLVDWATPTFATALGTTSQELAAGRISTAEYIDLIQENYAEFRETKA